MRELLIEDNKSPKSNLVDNNVRVKLSSRRDFLRASNECVSFELCPNRELKTKSLSKLNANFCSVTWHSASPDDPRNAGQIPAIVLAKRLRSQGYEVLLHVAGRNLARSQAREILTAAKGIGVTSIFALQGDPSQVIEQDDSKCDFPYAANLVSFIREAFGEYFTIGVAGYPEKHPKCQNLEEDILYLRHKVSCGADFIITQASYNYEAFEQFVTLCRMKNINIPIIPGIFIISSYKSLIAMSSFCGVPISDEIFTTVSNNRDNREAVKEYGLFYAEKLMKKILYRRDLFQCIHIFTLNDLTVSKNLLRRLRLYQIYIERPLKNVNQLINESSLQIC